MPILDECSGWRSDSEEARDDASLANAAAAAATPPAAVPDGDRDDEYIPLTLARSEAAAESWLPNFLEPLWPPFPPPPLPNRSFSPPPPPPPPTSSSSPPISPSSPIIPIISAESDPRRSTAAGTDPNNNSL